MQQQTYQNVNNVLFIFNYIYYLNYRDQEVTCQKKTIIIIL